MLQRVHQLALVLWPWRSIAWILLACSIATFAYAILSDGTPRELEQVSLLGSVWATLLLTLIYGFVRIPEAQTTGFWRKLGRRFHRAAYYVLALLTFGATLIFLGLIIRFVLHGTNQ